MKFLRSCFNYNKRQRNGVFFFLVCILIFQIIYYYVDDVDLLKPNTATQKEQLLVLQHQLDSLRVLKLKKSKIFKFNPNFITDAKGYRLGMSIQEIDRLLAYRKKGLWLNSPQEFKGVTKVNDSLFNILKPLFVFSEKRFIQTKLQTSLYKKEIRDLNTVTAEELIKVKGIGNKLSKRIVKYRDKLGGFSFESQLTEVYGLNQKTIKNVLESFKLISTPSLQKIDVNTASFKEVLDIVYTDYRTTKMIFDYRDAVGVILDIEELKKIPGFPIDKYKRIVLYLRVK